MRVRLGLLAALALIAAPAVRADLGGRGGDAADNSSGLVLSFDSFESASKSLQGGTRSLAQALASQIELPAIGVGELSSTALAGLPVSSPATAVIDLPPAPSSAGLFLSAMLSLGAWQLVRSSRDINLSALPDWYHSGGPVQIGHVTPFDLDFSALTLCCFEQPETGQSFQFVPRRDDCTRHVEQFISCSADPRGPPAHTA